MECRMKAFKGADFVKRTFSAEAVQTLHAELKLCLSDVPCHASSPDQLLDQRVVCDRVLRACNHWAGDASCHDQHLQSLVPLVELACFGFRASGPQRTPIYLEKILFHLLKNFSARESSFSSCTQLSDLLYSSLSSYPKEQQNGGDFTAVAKSGFQLLWKAAGDQEQKQSPCPHNRETLCLRLHALRFLLLLEGSMSHGDSSLSVSRHTSFVVLAFESKGKSCSQDDAHFLNQSIQKLLVLPLIQHGAVTGPRARCLLELTLESCRLLCKSGCPQQGREVVKQACEYLKRSERCCQAGLALLDLAVAVHEGRRAHGITQLLSKTTDTVRGARFSGEGWLCQALGECCHFAVSCLDGQVGHAVDAVTQGVNEVLSLAELLEVHYHLLEEQVSTAPKGATRQRKVLKQQQFGSLQQFTNAVCAFLQSGKDTKCDRLHLLLGACRDAISRILSSLQDLPDQDAAEFFNITASCVHNLAYWFYSQKMYQEASDLVSPLCERLAMPGADPDLAVERLHRCFRLYVECCRKAGQSERGCAAVSLWLRALRAQVTQQIAEPIALWVRVKMDGAKNGEEDLRLKTLKDGLTDYPLDPEMMVFLLAEELRGYKSVHGDTGQERYNTICDLLELCSEGSSLQHHRAPFLLELAQVLCYHDYTEQTDCSALDAVQESLRLLDSASAISENHERLLDIKAQALLWHYICTLEANMKEGLEVQRRKAKDANQRQWSGVEYEPNDLNYEDKLHDDQSVRDGICFTLAGEAGPMKNLDEALTLWKGLLSGPQVPSLKSAEQTVFSLHLLGSLYRLMGKPLQSIQSFQLVSRLCHSLEDHIGEVGALCHLTKLLFYLESPQQAQVSLQKAEEVLRCADHASESYTLTELSCRLLRSHLCRVTYKVEEGVALLLGVLQHPSLQKSSKVWYILKVQVLQQLSLFLSLPSTSLFPELHKQLCAHGWHNPETALTDAHKLLRSIVLLLLGNEVLSSPRGSSEVRFVDHGENLLQKWQVLADLLSCSQDLIGTLCRVGSVSEAKSFCLEGLKLAKSLQSMRHCADFLVRKAELATLRSEGAICEEDLQYVVFLMESCTDFTAKEQQKEVKINLRKGKPSNRKGKVAQAPQSPPKEDFLKGVALQYVDTRDELKSPDSPTSPPCREKTPPHFLSHPLDCTCPLCSDLMLSLLCTRWLVAQAENDAQSRKLLILALQRCRSITRRFSGILQELLSQGELKPAALGVADELIARVYLALASLSPSAQLPEGTLEDGLSFLTSRPASFPKHWRAGLLLAKALKSIYKLSAKHGGCIADLFMHAWDWQPPQVGKKPSDLNHKSKVPPPITLASKKKGSEPVPLDLQAVFSLEDSNTERPAMPHSGLATPMQKYRPPSKPGTALATLQTKSTVTVYNDESPMPAALPRAPRGRKARTVFKVVFSDSDLEVPDNLDPEPCLSSKKKTGHVKHGGRGRGAARMQGALESDEEEASVKGRPRKGRPGAKKAPEECSPPGPQRRSRRGKMEAAPEEVELLRAIQEEPEGLLDISIEELRGSDTEEQKPLRVGRKRQKPLKKDGAMTECEVLRRDAGGEHGTWTMGKREQETAPNPFSITELSSSLPTAFSTSDLDSVSSLLREALESVAHFPPCALYSQLCRLLALCSGGQDPYTTALLISESVSVTLRHQLLGDIHRKRRKLRREGSGDVCDKFQCLTLADPKDPHAQHLSQLEELFHFPTQALDTQRFKEQLQQIPTNTVVCVLTLADSQSGSPGDTLLLTRLVQGSSPVTVRIPTTHLKVPLSSALQEFDEIQKQQKMISNLTAKREWWEGRMGLDCRMKVLIGLLEERVLGCWKGLLMPPCSHPAVAEESDRLLGALSECGWNRADPALLKAVLGGSPHLTTQLTRSFIQGLSLSQPELAQELLQEAAERLKSHTGSTEGHLVLVLDKHLQKLPWESTPCLLSRSVTRLPSLHFLLSYGLLRKYRPPTTLVQGVDPKRVFYVLNAHANLSGTEERFRDWFKSEPGWKGVIRSAPKSEELQSALTKQDLYIYVGHGAGAHFLDAQTLQRLDCNAVVLLFGCSSAALAVRGDLEGAGIVLKYLLAGCPLVLGNLWDVTDREIDRYTVAFLQSWLKAGPDAPLLKYLSESRQAPKLKYIIGAALWLMGYLCP